MATIAMNEAGYISSGHYPVDQYYHYGLALEFYTHFTVSDPHEFKMPFSTAKSLLLQSPIRRYADVVAHRQLLMCVDDPMALRDNNNRASVMFNDKTIAEICDNLNLKSRESKFAQRVLLIIRNL